MTWQDLALFTWVPAVLALTWHVRKLNQAHNKLNEKARLERNWLMSGHQIHKDKLATLETGIKAIEVRTRGFDPTQTSRELRQLRELVDAITEHIRPKPNECRHEFRLVSTNNPYLFKYRCSVCNKTEDIDAGAELAKRYSKTIDQS